MIINGMTGSSSRFKRFDRSCLTVNSDKLRSAGNYKINFDVFTMESIDKYAKIDGSEDDGNAMSASGNDVNYADVEFANDETNVQHQNSSGYQLTNITMDLQEVLQYKYMSAVLGVLILKILFLTTLKKLNMKLMNLMV